MLKAGRAIILRPNSHRIENLIFDRHAEAHDLPTSGLTSARLI